MVWLDWSNNNGGQVVVRNRKDSVIVAFVRNKEARKLLEEYRADLVERSIIFKKIDRKRPGLCGLFRAPEESIYFITFNTEHEFALRKWINKFVNKIVNTFKKTNTHYVFLKMCGTDGMTDIVKTSGSMIREIPGATVSELEVLLTNVFE